MCFVLAEIKHQGNYGIKGNVDFLDKIKNARRMFVSKKYGTCFKTTSCK